MAGTSILAQLLRALAAWLEWKAKTAPQDHRLRLLREIDETEDEIDRLRDAGTPAAQLRADRLRRRALALRGVVASLPASGAPAASGQAGADDGRDPHAAGR